MKDIMISIWPEYAAKIYSGEKTVEFRRRLPASASEWRRMYIYETNPVRMVTGYADIRPHCMSVRGIWLAFGTEGCINQFDYLDYMKGSDRAWALDILKVFKFAEPLPLSSFGFDRPPQSWRYTLTNALKIKE